MEKSISHAVSLSDKFRLTYLKTTEPCHFLNALSERLPENTEERGTLTYSSATLTRRFRLLNAFDPRTCGNRAAPARRRARRDGCSRAPWACWGFPTRLCPAMIMWVK